MSRLVPMNLTIRSHHTNVFDDLRDHAERKLERLERLLPRVDDVVVEIAHEETKAAAHRYAVQVTVHSGRSILRAEERAADPRAAFDAASDVLSRQARRHKKRLHDWHGAVNTKEWVPAPEAATAEADHEEAEVEAEYVLGRVVRMKHFEAKPMSEEEALTQMDLVGHDFFLFLDARTNDFALLYKRKDGDYGLLTPKRG